MQTDGLAGPCDGSLKGALWCDQSRSFKQRAGRGQVSSEGLR